MRKAFCKMAAMGSAVAFIVGGSAGISQAADQKSVDVYSAHEELTTVPVQRIGPTANGLTEVDLANGEVIQVPNRLASKVKVQSGVRPDDTDYVYGNCGDSYSSMIENPSSNTPYRFNTGFDIDSEPAIYYSWYATISGPYSYVYQYHASGDLAFRYSWHGGHTGSGGTGGWWARVSTESYAMLADGTICTSGGPVVFAAL
jgi:hypothetical protein